MIGEVKMELIIRNDSNVKVSIYKDETVISTVVDDGENSSSILYTADGASIKLL